MGIFMLEPAARQQIAALDQRLDDSVIGVAPLALLGQHALAFEAGGLVGVNGIFVDRVRDAGFDVALGQHSPRRHPDFKVLAPVAGRGVDEAVPASSVT